MQEAIENLNNSVSIKNLELIGKNCSMKKIPGPDGFVGEFYQLLDLRMK